MSDMPRGRDGTVHPEGSGDTDVEPNQPSVQRFAVACHQCHAEVKVKIFANGYRGMCSECGHVNFIRQQEMFGSD